MEANEAVAQILTEYLNSNKKYPLFHSPHEGFAIILEEIDELKAEVWKRKPDMNAMRKEAVQVAAMALKFLVSIPAIE